MSDVTLAQDSALDTAKTFRNMAADLQSRANELLQFAFLIDESVRVGGFFNNTFVQNVTRVGTSALMNNNSMGSLASALYSATAAAQYQADSK